MPFLGGTMEGRNEAFQKLKPICVELSQAALALQGPRGSVPTLTERLADLDRTVKSASVGDQLDEKLADYVFFPLSHVLKLSQRVSIRCLELTLSVLSELIHRGWRQHVQPQLASQMLILCTLLASEKPTGLASSETTIELRTNALRCLHRLLDALSASKSGKQLLQGDANVPQLGHTLSTILDALLDVDYLSTQTAAVDALSALVRSLHQSEIMARFLPGTISKLTKILTPKAKLRRNHFVLISCLEVLSGLLRDILSDESTTALLSHRPSVDKSLDLNKGATIIDSDWIEAAATQVKPALVSVFRLRSSDREDVRQALARLCIVLLDKCSNSLANCSQIALDTLVSLQVKPYSSSVIAELETLLLSNALKFSLLEEHLLDWLRSLPRVMQSADDEAKTEKLQKIQLTYELLMRCGTPAQLVTSEMMRALHDSMILAFQSNKAHKTTEPTVQPIQSLDLTIPANDQLQLNFKPLLSQSRGQEDVIRTIEALITSSSRSRTFKVAMSEVARSLRNSVADAQTVNFWLTYVAAKATMDRRSQFANNFFVNSGDEEVEAQEALEELYDFSLLVLSDSSEQQPDSRMQALALRGLALRAQSAGRDFRYELVDALYPVLHSLATPDTQLQQDSITALNVLTKACEYSSAQDLIVSNVDYLTNAVALKLNAFDVSPQAPQVLLMMVRLAGPSLLPYLEDTIESIFAALEDFHGYPLLVELLFRVLSVVAEEGAKAPQLAIANGPASEVMSHAEEGQKPLEMVRLAELLVERVRDEATQAQDDHGNLAEHRAPQKPWKTADAGDDAVNEDADAPEDERQVDDTPPPPAPKTYNLLLKITELTQHFLPSASPSLRTSLLGLIHTSAPALAKHENSFLPLINTLWPEVTARLDDSEAHVQAAAMHIIADLCENAKDFMRSRMVELWPIIVEIHGRVSKEIVALSAPSSQAQAHSGTSKASQALMKNEKNFRQAVLRMQAAPADYSNTSLRLLWEALERMISTAVRYVALPPEKVEGALEMLAPVLGQRAVREVFERQNADALWLMDLRSGMVKDVVEPAVLMGRSWEWAAVPG